MHNTDSYIGPVHLHVGEKRPTAMGGTPSKKVVYSNELPIVWRVCSFVCVGICETAKRCEAVRAFKVQCVCVCARTTEESHTTHTRATFIVCVCECVFFFFRAVTRCAKKNAYVDHFDRAKHLSPAPPDRNTMIMPTRVCRTHISIATPRIDCTFRLSTARCELRSVDRNLTQQTCAHAGRAPPLECPRLHTASTIVWPRLAATATKPQTKTERTHARTHARSRIINTRRR